MASKKVHSFILLSLLMILPLPSHCADPDPVQDFCIADLQRGPLVNGYPCKPAWNVTPDDFFFDGLTKEGNMSNRLRSFVTNGNVTAFPGLNTLGMSMNRVDVAPGGITHPHTHPRSTECGVVIRGKLLVGLITTGNVVHARNLSVGEVFVIPRGVVHFQMNVGEEDVLVFTAFNSQMPGTIQISKNLFSRRAGSDSVPDEVLMKAFQVNKTVIDQIRAGVSKL